jgi:hypothetical protein
MFFGSDASTNPSLSPVTAILVSDGSERLSGPR